MTKSIFGGVVISREADQVARELILEFHIPKQYDLAFLLDINKCFDDHQVIRLWIQKLIDEAQVDLDDLYIQVRNKFYRLIY